MVLYGSDRDQVIRWSAMAGFRFRSGDALDSPAQAKIDIALYRLTQGNRSHVKGLGSGVAEMKVDFGPGYRIYFGRMG